MTIKTRVSGQSGSNDCIIIWSSEGELLATVRLASANTATLEVETKEGLYITKPTGWSSKK